MLHIQIHGVSQLGTGQQKVRTGQDLKVKKNTTYFTLPGRKTSPSRKSSFKYKTSLSVRPLLNERPFRKLPLKIDKKIKPE